MKRFLLDPLLLLLFTGKESWIEVQGVRYDDIFDVDGHSRWGNG